MNRLALALALYTLPFLIAPTAAEPASSSPIKITEQGETISQKFGILSIAERSLEVMLSGTLLASFSDWREDVSAKDVSQFRETMEELSTLAYPIFKNTVHRHGATFKLFLDATPVREMSNVYFGSRPAYREKAAGTMDGIRAIPWVFSWTQARFVLPGWYGIGSGLQKAIDTFGEDAFGEMFREWYFHRSLTADNEMVLAKADLGIAELYSKLAGDDLHNEFFPVIKTEFELTRDLVLDYSDHDSLLDGDVTLQRAIMLRNPYVDPMSLMQVDLLARWRATDYEDEDIFNALLASVNGIAQALQNTG